MSPASCLLGRQNLCGIDLPITSVQKITICGRIVHAKTAFSGQSARDSAEAPRRAHLAAIKRKKL